MRQLEVCAKSKEKNSQIDRVMVNMVPNFWRILLGIARRFKNTHTLYIKEGDVLIVVPVLPEEENESDTNPPEGGPDKA